MIKAKLTTGGYMTYTFQFEDGSKVVYEADTLDEAMQLRARDYGSQPWSLVKVDPLRRDMDNNAHKMFAFVGVVVALCVSACSSSNKLNRDFCSENPGHESCLVSTQISEGK